MSDETLGGLHGEMVLYQAADGQVSIDVRLEHDSLWLSQRQMSRLFDKDSDTIGLHLRNIYDEGELEESSNTEESSVVQDEGKRQVRRRVRLYNLDAIISVGYRVNSKQGTRFRIWATRVLRDHLVKGYSLNEKRLRDLNQAVRLIVDTARRRDLSDDEAKALLAVVGDYNQALGLLDDYDHERVVKPRSVLPATYALGYDEALRIVEQLQRRSGASSLFGMEKDSSLAGALGAIMQTFDGEELYHGLEEKAAHLLYFLVKNHAFVDGNKRIGAALFLWFLERNGALQKVDGTPRVSNATLVALTLMIAESRPDEKEALTRIVMQLLVTGD
ncbi:MAG: cytochrome C biogenesis protein CycH [Spirochaetae bacterium HGW-Spirochaetae-7]|nr:MAG: cytochrome C biogenesis protein CycH [Spirochaetae bacterium HGW-Spirochaetae-7]